LNTVEYLDPVNDEWTTFIPVDTLDFPEDLVETELEADSDALPEDVTAGDKSDDVAVDKADANAVGNDDVPDLEEVSQAGARQPGSEE
jgi:hypothetical protein